MEDLTTATGCSPNVVKEVEHQVSIKRLHEVKPYSKRDVTDTTDGPPVIRLYHRGPDHPGVWSIGCVTCGCEVAKILHGLHEGVPGRCGYCFVKLVLTLEKLIIKQVKIYVIPMTLYY